MSHSLAARRVRGNRSGMTGVRLSVKKSPEHFTVQTPPEAGGGTRGNWFRPRGASCLLIKKAPACSAEHASA